MEILVLCSGWIILILAIVAWDRFKNRRANSADRRNGDGGGLGGVDTSGCGSGDADGGAGRGDSGGGGGDGAGGDGSGGCGGGGCGGGGGD